MRGRAELIVGLGAGILGVLVALAATLVPLTSGGVYAAIKYSNGTTKVIQDTQTIANLIQLVGAPKALFVCSTFVVLSVWILIATVAHTRSSDVQSLYLLWVGTLLLIFMCTIGGILLTFEVAIPFQNVGLPLIPVAVLALIGTLLASVRQRLLNHA